MDLWGGLRFMAKQPPLKTRRHPGVKVHFDSSRNRRKRVSSDISFHQTTKPDMVAFNKIKAATGEAPLISAISEDDISTRTTWGLWVCFTEIDKVKYPFKIFSNKLNESFLLNSMTEKSTEFAESMFGQKRMLIWENNLPASEATRMKTCNMLHLGQWHNHNGKMVIKWAGGPKSLTFESCASFGGEAYCYCFGRDRSHLRSQEGASKPEGFIYQIQAFLNDASKRQVEEEAAKLWLKDLESIAYEADNLLDEFNYEIVRRKVEIKNQMKRKVCFFCFSNPVLFRSKLAHKIKNLNMKLKKANDEAVATHLQQSLKSATFVPPVTETDSMTVDPIVVGREKDVSMIVDML
ncbi:UNVERIFIED_CONTAM: Disease resistance protein RGA2 [Sesamum radiatum]|uniref:Disease resistance protein RGA2 n=1 Tax=Sesamum radiatum TaxID=300843 RepID=A0AAW2VP63_SESRA